ncbi:SET domain-containing protein [Acrodontium crateriforme]|uniref:SET domain-containing protein n=1 Tax=Acrodontium crateriforme TaxID=150365 RepID=A0AAQ3LYS6_9PEZI|nr:SET domain-containing protein [Acrodontium crateriforme]
MSPGISKDDADIQAIVRDVTARINEQLPSLIRELFEGRFDGDSGPLQLECSIASANTRGTSPRRIRIAALGIDNARLLSSRPDRSQQTGEYALTQVAAHRNLRLRSLPTSSVSTEVDDTRPSKRRKDTGGLRISSAAHSDGTNSSGTGVARRLGSDLRVFPQRKKRASENPVLQPSTLEKFISGIWESIYSGVKLDPSEVIGQWQAIESSGAPRLLLTTDQEIASQDDTAAKGNFGRINVLARKISQTSRTCRSLEVIVQAYWVKCFDERVLELTETMSREKAKKATIAEACVDFRWSEKELRNKMGVWRGYYEIKAAGGWAALVFAGMGLYRFCKYRVSFTDDLFQTLRLLRHRIEVASDTLHPRWRQLLAIVGEPTDPKYVGHPHDWVVNGPQNEAIPLADTYRQWDENFSFTHLDESNIDEDAWGLFDPRLDRPAPPTAVRDLIDSQDIYTCSVCSAVQSDNARVNECTCYPALYGSVRALAPAPVQIYRTPTGKNNGLIACLQFERGSAIGEFIGLITSGLSGLDVMVGQTQRATYQIWQGRAGNHTRFVNHSCAPNAQFERFTWKGVQRVVLVSKGIEAGEEITVDYTDSYWKNLDKECLCGQPKCRYRDRNPQQLPELASLTE